MSLPEEFRDQHRSPLEMHGMHLGKVLRALARLRKDRGTSIGDCAGWTAAIVEVAAAIRGDALTAKFAENVCVRINIDPDLDVLRRMTDKARREITTGTFRLSSWRVIGKLVDFMRDEEIALKDQLGLKRILLIPADDAERRKRQNREAQAARRAAAGASPQKSSKAATARRLGVHRSTLYRRPDATLSSAFPMEAGNRAEQVANRATLSSALSGQRDTFVSIPLSTETADESVASEPVTPAVPIPGSSSRSHRRAS
jgi:hypothetical protein